jgi:hypothetical protein
MLQASGRFRAYSPEQEGACRASVASAGNAERIAAVLDRYWEFYRNKDCDGLDFSLDIYLFSKLALFEDGKTRYGRKDVEGFAAALPGFNGRPPAGDRRWGEFAGHFLSALMELSRSRAFRISTRGLDCLLTDIGYRTAKRIEVLGDVGDYAGSSMQGGSLSVTGSAGNCLGVGMDAGTIEVGNAGKEAGCGMKGGRIVITHDAGESLGEDMRGGEIHVHGKIASLGDVKNGKIFHEGKLVVDR